MKKSWVLLLQRENWCLLPTSSELFDMMYFGYWAKIWHIKHMLIILIFSQSLFFPLSLCRKAFGFGRMHTPERSKKSLCVHCSNHWWFYVTFPFSTDKTRHPFVLILGSSGFFCSWEELAAWSQTLLWYLRGFLPPQNLSLLSHASSAQRMSSGCNSIP